MPMTRQLYIYDMCTILFLSGEQELNDSKTKFVLSCVNIVYGFDLVFTGYVVSWEAGVN